MDNNRVWLYEYEEDLDLGDNDWDKVDLAPEELDCRGLYSEEFCFNCDKYTSCPKDEDSYL